MDYKHIIKKAMTRYIISLFIILATLVLRAQEPITLLGLSHVPIDLTASTQPRKDVNGQPCALIKVILTTENAQFEGNVIGEVTFKTNEYWIYLSQGSKFLKVKIPGVEPVMVNFKDYGIDGLVSKQTYELAIKDNRTPSTSSSMQKLVVKYSPPDAKIQIDGFEFEGADGVLNTVLPIGQHAYEISKDDKVKSGNLMLFASQPLEIALDLTKKETAEANSLQEYESEEERIYFEALNKIKIGEEAQAEQIANRGIAQGFDICYEIIECLYMLGYYDQDLDKRKSIEEKIKGWSSKRHKITPSYKKILNNLPTFGLR